MEHKPMNPDARALEEAFFAEENRRLLQRLREKRDHEARRAAMREALPNADDALIDHLMELGIEPGTALAVTFVPLAMVAWADGEVAPSEREAILRAAEERGVSRGTPAREVLETWLGRKPGAELVAAWKRYVRTVGSGLDEQERRGIRERMLEMARGIASAEGGFLGLTKKISAAERVVLEEIEQAFR
jgi:hypothetical protein